LLIANYALNLYFLLLKIKIKSILKENRNSMRFELEVEISSPAFLLFIGETTNFFTGKMGCQISSPALILTYAMMERKYEDYRSFVTWISLLAVSL